MIYCIGIVQISYRSFQILVHGRGTSIFGGMEMHIVNSHHPLGLTQKIRIQKIYINLARLTLN